MLDARVFQMHSLLPLGLPYIPVFQDNPSLSRTISIIACCRGLIIESALSYSQKYPELGVNFILTFHTCKKKPSEVGVL